MPEGLLPVGSVVRLQGADEALVMVMGFEPVIDGTLCDYLGVPYPMGLATDDAALAFDADAVAQVVHRGYWDDEGDAGLAAVRRWRTVAADAESRIRELTESLTPERYLELRDHYTFGRFEEEPEPDFPDHDGLAAEPAWGSAEDEPEPEAFDDWEEEPEPDCPDEGGLA